MIGFLRKLWRSAVTGRFVTEDYAAEHPRETIGQTIRRLKSRSSNYAKKMETTDED